MTTPRPDIEDLFRRARRLPADQRERFVNQRCNGHTAERREVLTLLRHADAPDSFLDSPAVVETSQEACALLPDGTRVGRYRIVRHLGDGGMGEVYLADQDAPVRRRVALKLIKPGMDSRQIVGRFERERQVLALMNHAGIAQVFDAGVTDRGRSFFAMEYVDGRPLVEACDQRRSSVEQRLHLFIQACEAVQHAHQKGVIHRDLKPSNILLGDAPDTAPKVIDFGIAKATDPAMDGEVCYTRTGMLMGTPDYMSPEQAEPGSLVDTRSDIYSLGVILHELLVGTLPRKRNPVPVPPSTVATRESDAERAQQRGTSAEHLARRLHGDLDAIVLRAIDPDPDRRYSSASELGADIRRHLQREPVSARPPSLTYRLARLVQRYKGLSALSLALLVALIGGLSVSAYLSGIVREQRDSIYRLSDRAVLERVIREAEALWPPHDDRIPAIEAWLEGDARRLIERIPLHESSLAALRARQENDTEAEFFIGETRDLVQRLEALRGPEGLISRVRRRLEFARTIRRRSLEEPAAAWQTTVEAIARSPKYAGLRIRPQLGLLPLGADPESGLHEFAHLQSGSAPERDARGRLMLSEDTGLVLVLLPPARVTLGARRPVAGESAAVTPHVDPLARAKEGPVHVVNIEHPFFLSKYEMTQGQWLRINHENPSDRPAGQPVGDGPVHTLLHPVERVDLPSAERTVRRMGLTLPSEAQWEYAARAGTVTPFWTGADRFSLEGAENLGDLSHNRRIDVNLDEIAPWDDGYPDTSPVGRFRANPLGFHDVQGNVWEWCSALHSGFHSDPDLLRSDGRIGVFRGGSCKRSHTRMSRRVTLNEDNAYDVGLRPAGILQP